MAGSNIRSTNHEKCDPDFIRSFGNSKGLGTSKAAWAKMTPAAMKKENGKCVSIKESLSKEELAAIVARYS